MSKRKRSGEIASVALTVSVVMVVGVGFGWSMTRRERLDEESAAAATIDNVPAARRHLDGFLRQLEYMGLTSGNTSLFSPVPENDLARWYGRLQEQRRELVRVEALADPQAHVLALRAFRQSMIGSPSWIRIYPYQRSFIGVMTFSTGLVLLLVTLNLLRLRKQSEEEDEDGDSSPA